MVDISDIYFEIPGEPKGKGRPRFARRGDFVQTYSPNETVVYENLVKMAYTNGSNPKLEGPIRLKLLIYFPIPKSVSKKKHEAMLEERILPTVKKDIDNVIKCVLDGLNHVAYDDDKQIIELIAKKRYSDQPRVCVTLSKIHTKQEGE